MIENGCFIKLYKNNFSLDLYKKDSKTLRIFNDKIIKSIFLDGKLYIDSVCKNYLQTAEDGRKFHH